MNYIYVLLIIELILVIIVYEIFDNDILSPSVVTTIVFLVSTLCAAYNIEYWNVYINGISFFVIFIGLLTVVCAEILNRKLWGRKSKEFVDLSDSYYTAYNTSTFSIFAVIGIALSLVYISGVFSRGGMSLVAIGISKIGRLWRPIDMVAFYYNAFVGMVSGFVLLRNKLVANISLKNMKLLFAHSVFVIIVLFFSGTRTYVLRYIIALVLISWILINEKYMWRRKAKSKKKVYMRMAILVVLFIGFFYVTRAIIKNRTNDVTDFITYFTYYVGSPIHLLSKNIQLKNLAPSNIWGENTLVALYTSLNDIGFGFDINTQLPMTAMGGSLAASGNTYTLFYRPYCDFGIVGVITVTFVVYYIFSMLYYRYFKNRYNSKKNPMILIVYSFFYYIVVMSFYDLYLCLELKLMNLVYIIMIYVIWRISEKCTIKLGSGNN